MWGSFTSSASRLLSKLRRGREGGRVLSSQLLLFLQFTRTPNDQVPLYSVGTMRRTSITVQSFPITETSLRPFFFLPRSRSAGIKTMCNSQQRPGGEPKHFSSLHFSLLDFLLEHEEKKKTHTQQLLYYFNKLFGFNTLLIPGVEVRATALPGFQSPSRHDTHVLVKNYSNYEIKQRLPQTAINCHIGKHFVAGCYRICSYTRRSRRSTTSKY